MKLITTKRGKDGVKRRFVTDLATGKIVEGGTRSRALTPSDGDYYQISSSNGVPAHQVEQAKAVDRQLGVPITYLQDGPIAYAAFDDRSQKNKWLRAHRRVDHDAGYSEPAPGDFAGR
jgi:hypothetical protein